MSDTNLSTLFDLSGIQDSFCFQNLTQSRLWAQELVGDDGEFHRKALGSHKFFTRWIQDDAFFKSFRRFSRPLCHRGAEKLVRESLLLPPHTPILDCHIRRAVISACLTPLRQNVGSCFATAPAILIQDEQIDAMVQDLYDILMTGKLKRTFGGIEYVVPLSLSWGMGDLSKSILQSGGNLWASPGLMAAFEAAKLLDSQLPLDKKIEAQSKIIIPVVERGKDMTVGQLLETLVPPAKIEEAKNAFRGLVDHALLKAWEFTLASFSEVKMEFSRWNLYLSLGLHPEEKGGLGQIIYQAVNEKLQQANQKMGQYQVEYERAFDQLRSVESLLKRASTEAEMRRLQAEAQAGYHHMSSCQDLRDKYHMEAKQYSLFFSFLLQQYNDKFLEYFQETYDPEMIEEARGLYEDSPAGFRLFYKHGRPDASLWSPIHAPDEFIRFLTNFFATTEMAIGASCVTDEERRLLTEVTSMVIQYIRTEEFLRFTMGRMAKMGKTPWSYISGGTMETLLKTYYRREGSFSCEERRVESPLDLLTFLIDTLKSLPPRITERFIQDPTLRLLMHSPTHAFTLLPGLDLFCRAWQDEGFTYTWIRDQFLHPALEFYESLTFSPREQTLFAERLNIRLPSSRSLSLTEFAESLPQTPEVSSFLYRSLPAGKKPSLLFADTNWSNNYFAFVVSPLTRQLELWRTDPTGAVGLPMASWSKYLQGKEKTPWGIYTNPEEYR